MFVSRHEKKNMHKLNLGSNYDSLIVRMHGRVSGPSSLLDQEVIAPCGYSVPCQF